jgi:multidrug transporter EmrE-like cation transporter
VHEHGDVVVAFNASFAAPAVDSLKLAELYPVWRVTATILSFVVGRLGAHAVRRSQVSEADAVVCCGGG